MISHTMQSKVIKATCVNPDKHGARALLLAKTIHENSRAALKAEERTLRKRLALRLRLLRKRAYAFGYKKGQKHALRELTDALEIADTAYRNSLKQAKQDCLWIIEKIAKEVLQKDIHNSYSLETRLETCINSLLDKRVIRIHLNKNDIDNVRKYFNEKHPSLHITLEAQENVNKGNASIQTTSGRITLNWCEHLEQLLSIVEEQYELPS